jgi:hypothetical protein
MLTVKRDGEVTVLQFDYETAAIVQNLICAARPRGQAEHARIRVEIIDDTVIVATPTHEPINAT